MPGSGAQACLSYSAPGTRGARGAASRCKQCKVSLWAPRRAARKPGPRGERLRKGAETAGVTLVPRASQRPAARRDSRPARHLHAAAPPARHLYGRGERRLRHAGTVHARRGGSARRGLVGVSSDLCARGSARWDPGRWFGGLGGSCAFLAWLEGCGWRCH